MKQTSYLGTSRKALKANIRRTIRKSRRLMLKEKRNRRASVGDMLGVTPAKTTRETGTNLREESAEQLALIAATRDQQWEQETRNVLTQQKHRGSRGKSVGTATWGLTRDGRRNRTTEEHFQDLFTTPMAGDDATTDESFGVEEPNTDDRRFIKNAGDSESDPDYEMTDPDEWSMEASVVKRRHRARDNLGETKHEIDEKNEVADSKFDEGLLGLGELLTPSSHGQLAGASEVPVKRQLTPEFEASAGGHISEDRANQHGKSRDQSEKEERRRC